VSHAVFENDGPWTEDAYLALVADGDVPAGRVELVDGSLLISPAAGERGSRLVARVREAVAAALPEGLDLAGSVPLRVAPGRVLVPDLVVATGRAGEGAVRDAGEVLLVIELGSAGSGLVDRSIKPQLYAEAGIPYHVRVELEGPSAVAYLLIGGRYLEHVRVADGEPLRLEDPFPVVVDLAGPVAAAAE
jgi:Uma2 family endonuclease